MEDTTYLHHNHEPAGDGTRTTHTITTDTPQSRISEDANENDHNPIHQSHTTNGARIQPQTSEAKNTTDRSKTLQSAEQENTQNILQPAQVLQRQQRPTQTATIPVHRKNTKRTAPGRSTHACNRTTTLLLLYSQNRGTSTGGEERWGGCGRTLSK